MNFDKPDTGNERTERVPAQEKMTPEAQEALPVPAEQVYAERLSESLPEGHFSNPIFIP